MPHQYAEDGGNGLLVQPGNPAAIAQAVRRIAGDGGFEQSLRRRARATYETVYHPEANLRLLRQIYEQAAQAR